MKSSLHPQGTRVRIQRGRRPMDPALLDRTGLVVRLYPNKPGKYGVQLDGESRIRSFAEDELQALASPATLEEAGDTGPGVGPGTGRV